MTKAEQNFIENYTKRLLIDWAHHQVTSPEIPEFLERCGNTCAYNHQKYIDFAIYKGWVSKDGKRVLAKGFTAAVSALKRGNA